MTATVASSTIGMPTGTVTFMDGNTQLGTGALGSNGQALLNTQQLSPGTNIITAIYPGDRNFRPSTSASVTVTVTNEMLTMTIKPAALNIPAGKMGQAVLTLTPMNAFSDTVHFSCAGLARGMTCQFSSPAPSSMHNQRSLNPSPSSSIPIHLVWPESGYRLKPFRSSD
jgi:hypothetical protein